MSASIRQSMLDIQMTQMFSQVIEGSNLLPGLKQGLLDASQKRIDMNVGHLIDAVRKGYDDDDDDAGLSIVVLN